MSWTPHSDIDTMVNSFEQKTENDKITETNVVMMIAEEIRGDLPLWLSYWRKSREPNTELSGECWVGYPHPHQWWSLRSLPVINNYYTVIWSYYWVSYFTICGEETENWGREASVLVNGSAEIIRLSTNKHQLYILQPELCLCYQPNNAMTTLVFYNFSPPVIKLRPDLVVA